MLQLEEGDASGAEPRDAGRAIDDREGGEEGEGGETPPGEGDFDEDDMENSLSLAAIEAELKPKVLETFEQHGVPLHMDIEMPTIETIKKLVGLNLGVAFLPRMCVEPEVRAGMLREVAVKEIQVERMIRLVQPARRAWLVASRLAVAPRQQS